MARERKPDLYYWRSHDGLEVDLLIVIDGKLQPVEIKLTATPAAGHVEPFNRFLALAGTEGAPRGLLICRTGQERALPNGHIALPWHEFPARLESVIA
jgi:hypothetical protein